MDKRKLIIATLMVVACLFAGLTMISVSCGGGGSSGSSAPVIPNHLVFTTQPADTVVDGTLQSFSVTVYDSNNNVVSLATNSILITATGLTLGGTNPKSAVNGVATFNDIIVGGSVGSYTLYASGAGLTGGASASFTLTIATKGLFFTTQPSTTAVGAVATTFIVAIKDAYGNIITNATDVVTISGVGLTIAGTDNGKAAIAGIARFENLTIGGLAGSYTLIAWAPSAALLSTATSNAFNLTGFGAANKLAFTTQPVATAVDAVATTFAVTVQDTYGNKVTTAIDNITIAGTGLTFTGDIAKAAVDGIATFDNITIRGTIGSKTLTATAGGLTGATSAAFALTGSGAISKIVFTTALRTAAAGIATAVMTIQTQDLSGNPSNVAANTTVNLTGAGTFSLLTTTWANVTSVTIANGTNTASFYYKDTAVGTTPTITADEAVNVGWTAATQVVTIGAYATAPAAIVLAKGSANPVYVVTNVGACAPGATDATGAVPSWDSVNNKIKFTVTAGIAGASIITIGGDSYTSDADYTITAAGTLTIVVTTTEALKTPAVRTFTVAVATSYATVPSAVVLAVGSETPVGGVTNVAIPLPAGTDSTGKVIGWVTTTADKIKFTVTAGSAGASTITFSVLGAYTSGADYALPSTASLTIVVTTTESGKTNAVRTFTVTVTAPQATPTFSPAAGAIAFGTTVTIISAGADAIYYTTTGVDPTTLSTNQTTPLVINAAVTVKALAVKAGYANSAIGSAAYTQAATADLSGLVLSGSPANYTFGATTYAYTGVTVLYAVATVTVTPSGAGVITVEGTPVATGNPSGAIALTVSVAKTITVVATETGKTAKTYTITVTRGAASTVATITTASTIKGAVMTTGTLGTPATTIAGATAGARTITVAQGGDVTNAGDFITLFVTTNADATTKVVKYVAVGTDTSGFATDTDYVGTAVVADGNMFVIRVIAEDGTTTLYYKIVVTVTG